MKTKRQNPCKPGLTWRRALTVLTGLVVAVALMLPTTAACQQSAGRTPSDAASSSEARPADTSVPTQLAGDARLQSIEKILQDLRGTVNMAEIRSYQNKMMSRELIRLVKAILITLMVIAVGFPLTIWLLTRKRMSGLSDEMAATLLSIEERQSKLAGVLRDIQVEIDYLHSSSGPDLKNLVDQAGKYLKDNERDLGVVRGEKASS